MEKPMRFCILLPRFATLSQALNLTCRLPLAAFVVRFSADAVLVSATLETGALPWAPRCFKWECVPMSGHRWRSIQPTC